MSRTMRWPSPVVFLGLLLVAGIPLSISGCASTFRAESTRPVQCAPPEVFTRVDGGSYRSAKLGIFPFRAPSYASEIENELSVIYWQEILRSGVFKEVILIPQQVEGVDEAIWWGRREKCSLIMMPQLVYMIGGSGALTNRLEVGIRVLDTQSGRLLWDFRQKASSNPGADIDLYWTTIPGKSAQGYRTLARSLAQQTSIAFLPPPPPKDGVGSRQNMQSENKWSNAECTPVFSSN